MKKFNEEILSERTYEDGETAVYRTKSGWWYQFRGSPDIYGPFKRLAEAKKEALKKE